MKLRPVAPRTPRLIAGIALGAAVLLGTTGCNMMARQATTMEYSPADGVDIPAASGPLDVRNVFVVTDEEGVDGNLAIVVVNNTTEGHTLTIESEAGIDTVRVPAGDVVSFGAEGLEPLPLDRLDAAAGTTTPMFFQSGDGEGVLIQVPVLDGTLEYLRHLVP